MTHALRAHRATPRRRVSAVLLLTMVLAGCSAEHSLFGGPKQATPVPTIDANIYPSNYRRQVAIMMIKLLANRADFQNGVIAPPMLRPVPDSPNQHYVVCLQFNNRTEHRDKVVIYLGGEPQQYVDATPQECDGAPYQPFPELLAVLPAK
ncbi:MAG: hypothetical protein WBF58_13570 [Xanthobacteraceae bacterium]